MIKKIEGLEEALERESKALRVSELDYDDIEIFITAARAYAKIQSGEFSEPKDNAYKEIIAVMAKSLEWYRKLFIDHPTDFALNTLRQDQGKVASDALDQWEVFFDGGLEAMIQAGEVKE